MGDVEAAERAGRRRVRVMMASAALFVTTQAVSFSGAGSARPESVRLTAWIVWAAVLCLLLAGFGGWAQPPGVRRLLDDELTREHRRASMVVGFWAALGMAAFSWALAAAGVVTATEGPRLVVTFGVATAVFAFAFAERAAYRDA